jgi:Transposase DDE domain
MSTTCSAQCAPGMIVLADRNFGTAPMVTAVAGTGADLLFRIKSGRGLPVCRRLADGSWISRMGRVTVRVIRAEISITTSDGRRSEVYQVVTTLLDPDPVTGHPAAEIIKLYHERWEIETAFLEVKSTILGGRVLRARTPAGVSQEVYALLVTYQALRIAISDATLSQPGLDPDRGSFTVALHAARDQLVAAAGVIADTVIDLVGEIGRQILDHLMPARRPRTNPRVVKRAISKYVASSKKGRHRGPGRKATISVGIIQAASPSPPGRPP